MISFHFWRMDRWFDDPRHRRVNGVLGFVQEYKAGRSLDALKEMVQTEARVIREGFSARFPLPALSPEICCSWKAGAVCRQICV